MHPETSPSLTLRPNVMACHQSSETHVASAVVYSHQHQHLAAADLGAAGGGATVLDVSDPSGNAMTLLRNVESVYFQSMTSEDEKNKAAREKMHAEDQCRRLQQDKDQLQQALAQEKARRTCVPPRLAASALARTSYSPADALARSLALAARTLPSRRSWSRTSC